MASEILTLRDENQALKQAAHEQAEKIRALEGKLALVMDERDAAEVKAAHLKRRLAVAHESIGLANDKMAEQVRQARWEVADEAIAEGFFDIDALRNHLAKIRDANAPKD